MSRPGLPWVLSEVQAWLAPGYRRLRRGVTRVDRALDRRRLSMADLETLLTELGVTPGATVLLHSSMDSLARRLPGLTPATLIRLVQGRLGETGTLLMPTFPFQGRQADYVDRCDRFDVRRTPSQAGLVTEVFRRMPGVVRSLHPTHPVAAWGRDARELVAAHHLGPTFGPESPMSRLAARGGRVVGLGTRPGEMFTILHVAEALHPGARAWAYAEPPRLMTIVDGDRRIPYRFQVLRPDRERDRLERRLLAALRRAGVIDDFVVRGLACATARVDRVIARAIELIDRLAGDRPSRSARRGRADLAPVTAGPDGARSA